jgi:DNA adenine methylase
MLPEIIDRLRRVQIVCQSAFDAIPRFDHEEGLIYCDPPYVHLHFPRM